MTESNPPPRDTVSLKPSEPMRKPRAPGLFAGLQLVWLVPILALIVTLGVGWNAIAGRGVVIRIDDITQRLAMEEIMVQSEKMLSVGGLAAGAITDDGDMPARHRAA